MSETPIQWPNEVGDLGEDEAREALSMLRSQYDNLLGMVEHRLERLRAKHHVNTRTDPDVKCWVKDNARLRKDIPEAHSRDKLAVLLAHRRSM